MSSFKLLDGAATNGRGAIASVSKAGEYRVSPDEAVAFGGASVSIDVRSKDDVTPEGWKPSGVVFTAANEPPQLIALQDGDEVSANRSGTQGAAITALLA